MTVFYPADFERVTDEAFSYLSADYGYTASPAERGGIFGSGFLRRFVRGSCEIAVCFGDADSQHLCTVGFRDDVGQDIAERSYTSRGLVTLLAQRHPAFVHPTRADLSGELTPGSVVAQYGSLLRDYAIDVIEGDFSAFPTLMYVLHHVDRKFPERAVRRFLGIYSAYEAVTEAVEDRRTKPGFAQRSDGFEIWRVQLDGTGFWGAGIPLDSSREHHG
jgi:hypothetical protein